MLPRRKALRLREYDYSQNGAYFITVCTKDKSCILWESVGADIIRPQAKLSEYGIIAERAINGISKHYPDITVEKYCIMPNHIHLLIMIDKPEIGRIISAPTISTVVGQMKRWASKSAGFPMWQKSFYDHIIRDMQGYIKIWRYIDENPAAWEQDCYYERKD